MQKIKLSELKEQTGVKFGTSGIRDTNQTLTDKVCYIYTKGFIQFLKKTNHIDKNGKIAIAGDLRESTERLLKCVNKVANDMGYKCINCGRIPTPAVTYFGKKKNIPSIMITGSHIPADRNGIKYQLSKREILKGDEKEILNQTVEVDETLFNANGMFNDSFDNIFPNEEKEAYNLFINRYLDFFPKDFLTDKKIGVYGHSAVGRDLICECLEKLGADVKKVNFLDEFFPVDTEAVDQKSIEQGRHWSKKHNLDAIVSTDGDSDRPLMSDQTGKWLRSDTICIPVANFFKAKAIAVPVSCNTAVDKTGFFEKIVRTKIGSPYVLKAMIELEKEGFENVVGYEANGGFMIQSDINLNGKVLESLPTRDALVVILTLLYISVKEDTDISEIINSLPKRYTASSSLKDFPTDKSNKILHQFSKGSFKQNVESIYKKIGRDNMEEIIDINMKDGVRITLSNKDIVHFRPSGNSPEFRCYTESTTQKRAKELNEKYLKIMKTWL